MQDAINVQLYYLQKNNTSGSSWPFSLPIEPQLALNGFSRLKLMMLEQLINVQG